MLKSALLASVASLSLALPVLAQDAPTKDSVVATVNGADITLGELIIAFSQLPEEYRQLSPEILFGGLVDQLVSQQLLAADIDAVPGRVELALVNERRSLLAGEVVNAIVQAAGTNEALQAAYDATYGSAAPGVEYNAAHILVATEQEVAAVQARLAAGEEFTVVAQEVSTDVGSGANGGDLGWFGVGMMVPEFEAAVLAATIGEVSAPVQTQFGFHLILVKETREQQPPTMDMVREELLGQVQQMAVEGHLAALRAAATVTEPEAGAFDPALITNLDLLQD